MNCQIPRSLLVAAALAVSSVLGASAQIVEQSFLIDFGSSQITTDPNDSWNNLPLAIASTDTGVLPGLISTDGEVTPINLQMVARFNGENTNGTTAPTQFPTTATRDSYYGNTGLFGGLTNIFPRFKMTNLDPAKTYDFTFYASRTGVTDVRETGYTVTGGISGFAALNVSNNVNNVAQVFSITPDSNGEILIALDPTANNTNSPTFFTYLGVMRLDVVPEPSAVLALVSGIGVLGMVRRRRN